MNPDATEVCNEIDDDCDIDDEDTSLDASTGSTWYADADGDDHGYTLDASDCDDSDATIHPGVEEGCPDEVDNDCDGTVDEADTDTVTVVVEGVDSDLDVCVPCSSGDLARPGPHRVEAVQCSACSRAGVMASASSTWPAGLG